MKRDKYDKLMSELVRERVNWTCEWPTCGVYYPEGISRRGLEHSHIYGRARHSVRWLPQNGTALCTGHHRYVTANPLEHEAFARDILGNEEYDALVLKAGKTRRWRPDEKAELYRQMKAALEDLKGRRAMGHTGRLEFHLPIAELTRLEAAK